MELRTLQSKTTLSQMTRGFVVVPKPTLFLAEGKYLTLREFGFYVLLTFVMDWDNGRPDSLGFIKPSIQQLAKFLQLSETTVYRLIEVLEDKGFLSTTRGKVFVKNPRRFTKEYASAMKTFYINNSREFFEIDRDIIANLHNKVANLRKSRHQSDHNTVTKNSISKANTGSCEQEEQSSKPFNSGFKENSNSNLVTQDIDTNMEEYLERNPIVEDC